MPENKSARDIIDERKFDAVVRLVDAVKEMEKELYESHRAIYPPAKIALNLAKKYWGVG